MCREHENQQNAHARRRVTGFLIVSIQIPQVIRGGAGTYALRPLTLVTRGSVSSRIEMKGISRNEERNSTWISSSLERGNASTADTPLTTRSWQALRDSESGSPPAGDRATISRLML